MAGQVRTGKGRSLKSYINIIHPYLKEFPACQNQVLAPRTTAVKHLMALSEGLKLISSAMCNTAPTVYNIISRCMTGIHSQSN